jgi:hypothetical protein
LQLIQQLNFTLRGVDVLFDDAMYFDTALDVLPVFDILM